MPRRTALLGIVLTCLAGCGQRDRFAPGTRVVICCPETEGALSVAVSVEVGKDRDSLDVPLGTRAEVLGRYEPSWLSPKDQAELKKLGGMVTIRLLDGPAAGKAAHAFAVNLRPDAPPPR